MIEIRKKSAVALFFYSRLINFYYSTCIYQVSNVEIKNLIYTIRGKQVMLDSDVASLYQCETKYLNRVVKRNIERFPDEFCFKLSENEFNCLRFQFVTLNNNNGRGQHRKYLPYVFTEYGIAMLSALLKSDIAIKMSIDIMKAFIEMRKILLSNSQVFERLTNVEYKLLEHDKRFDEVFNSLQHEENIIDGRKMYHLGASIKDLGKKCFAISRVENNEILRMMENIKINLN